MLNGKRPTFNLSQMGEADKRNLCSAFLDAAKAFYEDPENQKRFERWKREKERINRTSAQTT